MNRTSSAMSTSFERLSSGLRINSAKDDAAGLSISSRLTAQIKGINQAVRNGGEGISLAQTAEGALNETTNILQRIRELAVQSANDTNNSSDRESLQAEVSQLKQELDRIAETTNLNGSKLLDGSFLTKNLQLGPQSGERLSISIDGATTKHLGRQARYTSDEAFVNSAAIGDGTGGTQTLQISNERGDFNIRGTVPADDQLSTSLKSASAISKANAINASSAESGVRAIASQTELTAIAPVQTATLDQTDYITLNGVEISGFQVQEKDADGSLVNAINAESSKTGVVASLTSDSHLKLVAEDGRNIEFNVTINLVGSANSFGFFGAGSASGNGFDSFVATGKVTLQSEEAFRISSTNASVIGFSNEGLYGVNSENSVKELDISTRDGAIEALDTIDLAIEQTSSIRSMLGALQNRLESTLSNISTTKENLSASRSRIMDADYAQETAMLSRNQIIQQASISVLAQAIQQPQSILTLLGS
jgi:flagellin